MKDNSKITVNEAIEQWLYTKESGGVKSSTLETYYSRSKIHIVNEIGLMNLSSITQKQIYEWINNKKISNKTKNEILLILRQTFKFMESIDLLKINIMNKVKSFKVIKKKPTPLPLTQIKNIQLSAHLEIEPIITFCIWTGLQMPEVFALQWSDINFKKNIADINKTLLYKNSVYTEEEVTYPHNQRKVVLFTPALESLIRQNKLTKDYEHVFVNPATEKPWNTRTFKNAWANVLSEAKTKYRKPYILRITYTNLMICLGGRDEWLSRQLGIPIVSDIFRLHSSYFDIANKTSESVIRESLQKIQL